MRGVNEYRLDSKEFCRFFHPLAIDNEVVDGPHYEGGWDDQSVVRPSISIGTGDRKLPRQISQIDGGIYITLK